MNLKLREYQEFGLNDIRGKMAHGTKSILYQLPTGGGKTVLCANMLHNAAAKNVRSYFLVHRRELIRQSARTFYDAGIPHGVIAAGWPEAPGMKIQICSIQTLIRRLDTVKEPGLLVFDEAHHVAAGSWAKIYRHWPRAYKIGLSATPQRLDGKGLDDFFEAMVNGPKVATLIDQGYLAKYDLFSPGGMDVEGIGMQMGDFKKAALAEVCDRPSITGSAVGHYKQHLFGKRAVLFAVNVKASQNLVDEFTAAGIPAEHVDAKTHAQERDSTLKRLESGDTLVVSNVDLFGEGFDLPVLDSVFLLRPTCSLTMYMQQCGRALRPSPGKERAIIMDHAGNVERHGLPCQDREWALEGDPNKRNKKNGTGPAIKICPLCFYAQPAGKPSCKNPECGAEFPKQYREVDEFDGSLTKHRAPEVIRIERMRAQDECVSEEDLVSLGERWGLPRPRLWARSILLHRGE